MSLGPIQLFLKIGVVVGLTQYSKDLKRPGMDNFLFPSYRPEKLCFVIFVTYSLFKTNSEKCPPIPSNSKERTSGAPVAAKLRSEK